MHAQNLNRNSSTTSSLPPDLGQCQDSTIHQLNMTTLRRTRSIAGWNSVRQFAWMKAAYWFLGPALVRVTGDCVWELSTPPIDNKFEGLDLWREGVLVKEINLFGVSNWEVGRCDWMWMRWRANERLVELLESGPECSVFGLKTCWLVFVLVVWVGIDHCGSILLPIIGKHTGAWRRGNGWGDLHRIHQEKGVWT